MNIRLIEPLNESVDIPILDEPLRTFAKEGFDIAVFDGMKGDRYAPRYVPFRWEGEGESFTLCLGTRSDLSDAVNYPVTGTSFDIHWLLGGKRYYWCVRSDHAQSEVFSFTTEDTPRTVYIDGIANTRDLGGWPTADGRKIRQGMVYRSPAFLSVTDQGREHCRTHLGIRYELDLRPQGEADAGDGNGSYLGKTVVYQNIASPAYTEYFLPEMKGLLKKIFLFFTDPNHFPMVFHCQVGRDRTGTLAFMLLMLCGVPYKLARREYDIVFFTEFYRQGGASHRFIHETHFNPFVEKLRSYSDGTLSENAERFVIDLGLTNEDIAAIRRNLIED